MGKLKNMYKDTKVTINILKDNKKKYCFSEEQDVLKKEHSGEKGHIHTLQHELSLKTLC